jgi:hypothetical protein
MAEVLCHKQKREQTMTHFKLIAYGFKSHNDCVANDISLSKQGLLLKGVSQETEHLPFPVRRAGKPSQEWLIHNGEGKPLYSLRVEILPFMEGLPMSWDTTQPWESKPELLEGCTLFSYKSTITAGTASETGDKTLTNANVLAITGPGTAFGDGHEEQPKALKDIPPNVILAVEVRNSGIPWPAPGDFDIRTMPRTINAPDGKGISSRYPDGFHVIFADGKVWFLSDKVPFDTLKQCFTIVDAKKYDREKLLGAYVLDRGP